MDSALCRNLDLKPTLSSPISTKVRSSTSRPSHSQRLSCLSRRRSENWSESLVPSAWYKPKSETQSLGSQELFGSFGKGLFGFAAAAAALASVCWDSPALAESLTIAFPVSRTREVLTSLSVIISYTIAIYFAPLSCIWIYKI